MNRRTRLETLTSPIQGMAMIIIHALIRQEYSVVNRVEYGTLSVSRATLEQCRGQAVGAVGKKSSKSGCMRLREAATLYEFCDSFRYL